MLRFDRASEEQFLNKQVISEVAHLIVDQAKADFSDPHYKGRNIEFSQQWLTTEDFRAFAIAESSNNHKIQLSYGTAIEIYRDAFVLPEVCRRELHKKQWDKIYSLLGYGNDRKDVLPSGLKTSDAKITIIQQLTTWLYLHEQAHLLQRHREVAKLHDGTALFSDDGAFIDAIASGSSPLTGRDSAMRHAFELSADYEATTSQLLVEAARGMSEADLWCYVAGLMCLFQRFNRTASAEFDELPIGTHPHPVLRMRMIARKMEQIFALPDVLDYAPWAKKPLHVRNIIDHAVYTANIYWHLRYLGFEQMPKFLDLISIKTKVPPLYQQAIYDIWEEVRPEVVRGHLGHGEGVVLFLREPLAIG